ncbi:hypothetical protein [Rugosibacter aromaticivorans]|nr:hypothetical protein [Rugosibacter aromaticivorans]
MTEVVTRQVVANEEHVNRDPITGTLDAHLLGTGLARHLAALPKRLLEWQ